MADMTAMKLEIKAKNNKAIVLNLPAIGYNGKERMEGATKC
jgi:hypothetical protein